LREEVPKSTSAGRTEFVIGAGNSINMQSQITRARNDGRIMVAEAATGLSMMLGETVTLAANQSAANEFSTALLARGSLNNQDQLSLSVAVSKAGM